LFSSLFWFAIIRIFIITLDALDIRIGNLFLAQIWFWFLIVLPNDNNFHITHCIEGCASSSESAQMWSKETILLVDVWNRSWAVDNSLWVHHGSTWTSSVLVVTSHIPDFFTIFSEMKEGTLFLCFEFESHSRHENKQCLCLEE